MNNFSVETYTATIYIGLCPGYDLRFSEAEQFEILRATCQTYCNDIRLGLTITRTEFMYFNGNEPGAIIGLVNYPRFPKTPGEIKDNGCVLALKLKDVLKQERVSVVCSDETIMFGEK